MGFFQYRRACGDRTLKAVTRRGVEDRYYRNAHGALLVYDISNKASFDGAKEWLQELRKFGKPDIVILLVGNKLDLDATARQVPLEEALAFADSNELAFMETSAKTDVGVTMAFSSVVQGMCGTVLRTDLATMSGLRKRIKR